MSAISPGRLANGVWVPTPIVSVQYGSIALTGGGTTSNTATITAVNTTAAIVWPLGLLEDTASPVPAEVWSVRLDLTNATTVTATRNSGTTAAITIGFVVLEFVPAAVRSIQTGTLTFGSGSATGTSTITAVNTTRALVVSRGYGSGSGNPDTWASRITLTNATTLTATRSNGNATTPAHYWTVIEFW